MTLKHSNFVFCRKKKSRVSGSFFHVFYCCFFFNLKNRRRNENEMTTIGQKVKEGFKELFQAHYLTNLLLASSYFALKNTPYACEAIFESCLLEWREVEILSLLVIALAIKTRKAATWLQFVSTMCTFSKVIQLTTVYSPAKSTP